jgi:propanediol utilization protein
MNENEIREIVGRVLEKYSAVTGNPRVEERGGKIIVEASARHVHLTEEAVKVLFGEGERLNAVRELSQPGQFLSDRRVKLVTAKGVIDNVAVLGPERPTVQVELSLTDCRTLGLNAPINMSGDLNGAADVYIVGEKGMIFAQGSVIAAKAHIHMRPSDAKEYGVSDNQHVKVKIDGRRPVTFEDVVIRLNDNFAPAMHIDFDEANACCLEKNATGTILL